MQYTPLPHKDDFLLDLANNNYSIETVDNYERDLNFLEAFLWDSKLTFEMLDKLTISRYKGFLKKGDHLKAQLNLNNYKLAQKEQAELEEMELEFSQSSKSITSKEDTTESRSDTSKIDYKKKAGLGARSINRMLSSLRNYLKFLIEIDYEIPIAPDAIKLIRAEKKESQVAELDDLLALIESPDQFESRKKMKYRNRAMLELLFATGMRISELINLNRDQLNLYTQGNENMAGKMYIKGKGKKSRFIYLTERAKHYLERYLETRVDDYPALFIPYRGGRAGTKDPETVRISPNYLQAKIVEYRRKLGIIVPTSAHSLRHGFATYIAEEGANPAAIQRLLGHESLQTTTRYVHASDKFAEDAHRTYHPIQSVENTNDNDQ